MRRDDGDLVSAVRAGRTELFARLVERHAPAVFRIVRAGVRQEADADDLCQEVFLASFNALPRLREPARFRAHLLTIAARRVADHLRRRQRNTPLLPLEEEPPAPPAAERRSLREAVEDVVEEMSPAARLVFALRHHEGLSCKRIARILELKEGTVYSRLSRMHAAIRRAVAVEEDR